MTRKPTATGPIVSLASLRESKPAPIGSKRGVRAIKTFIAITLGTLIPYTSTLAQTTTTDYDTNDNGLIEIINLAQLNAIRWDLNGDGDVGAGDAANYLLAFPNRDTNAATRMGCPSGTCSGYELMNDLNFDTDGSGSVDSNDTYPNWNPIGDFSNLYAATFRGNGHTISHLTISSATDSALLGLFGRTRESATITGVGLVDVAITTSGNGVFVGALTGISSGTIVASYATGTVAQTGTSGLLGTSRVGGLIGWDDSGTITASWAGVTVSAAGDGSRVGGLVGQLQGGTLSASYATGRVTATGSNPDIGGLVGRSHSTSTVTHSYYDRITSGQSDTGKGEPKTTTELQAPTGYTGIYANWDVNVDGRPGNDDPWDFGQSNQYPTLRFPTVDYDTNNNGLIDITTLAQLNAIRHDLNGNGDATHADYVAAFPNRDTKAATRMGCPSGTCTGYELRNDLDFDENGNGARDDTYNQGDGWLPLGDGVSALFATTFNGNGHVIRNLYINRGSTSNVGLLGDATSPRIENLGLVDVDVTGGNETGGLAGTSSAGGSITAVYVTGQVNGGNNVGGLVGQITGGAITACYARVRVNGNQIVGGLVGNEASGSTTASYTLGRVSGTSFVSAFTSGLGTITASYWDTETSDIADDTDDNAPEGKTTAELQTPTDYTGIYANWNVNVDGVTGNDNPWAFGNALQYPVLRYGRTQAQINAQFRLQGDVAFADADINQDSEIDEQDALFMYQTYLPGVRGAGVAADDRERATAWQESGRAVGGDLNGDGPINHRDALIMYYAYAFEDLLNQSAVLRQLLLNGVRGRMPDTDATYRELLRRAKRLR